MLCREDGQEETFQKSLTHFPASLGDGGPIGQQPRQGAAKEQLSVEHLRLMLVLDDREDAWDAHSREHVLKIPAFHYFRDGGVLPIARNGPDCALLDVLHVVRDVQSAIATGAQPSVPAALHTIRRAVLAGVHLVFSGGLLQDSVNPRRSTHWRLAEAFGATCHLYWNAEVTHVVSTKPGTNTVKRALGTPGVFAVYVHWLTESCARWRRQAEAPYLLRPNSPLPTGAAAGAGGAPRGGPSALERPEQSAGRGAEGDGTPRTIAETIEAALQLVPSSLGAAVRLKALIKFLVPYEQKLMAERLFARFDRALETDDQSTKDEALVEITHLVGVETVRCALVALKMIAPSSSTST